MPAPAADLIAGLDPTHAADAVFVNAPLRDYTLRPRVNDFTLPVLGMAYIATFAAQSGYNVGVLDAEAHGLGVAETARAVNHIAPRWVGMNLLAPTYQLSAAIAQELDPGIRLMLGGHHAKALPHQVLADERFGRCDALVIGEGETRVAELLGDHRRRAELPGVMWVDRLLGKPVTGLGAPGNTYLAPDINALPFVDRRYLVQDPYSGPDGTREASLVGARGCPYDCSFCGAAVSANPDISIRTRRPDNILEEMNLLRADGVTAFRFVDDLFLGHRRVITTMMTAFTAEKVSEWASWDATGRINVLRRLTDTELDTLAANGLREVALGIESGNQRILDYIVKRITPEMAASVVTRLTQRGINVKGYFILGLPTETPDEIADTASLIRTLWHITSGHAGRFRSSTFQYRPYPGTPDWQRLLATGQYTSAQLLDYTSIDSTNGGTDLPMLDRDEFNFAIPTQLSAAPTELVRATLRDITIAEHERRSA